MSTTHGSGPPPGRPDAPHADDPHELARFVAAQDAVFDDVLAELAAGAKRTHWMWFVFPQRRELGRSAMAHHYGLGSLAEARAYWAHPVLGPRLARCLETLAALPASATALGVFGPVDALKLRSCLTLFEAAAPAAPRLAGLIVRYFGGERDAATLALLARDAGDDTTR